MAISWTYTPPKVNAAVVLNAAGAVAVEAGAQMILDASQPLVPVDTGALKASGKVSADGLEAAVSYSGIAPDGFDYGIKQHEDGSLHHPNGGQWKYLEQPMHTEAPAVATEMAAIIRKAMKL